MAELQGTRLPDTTLGEAGEGWEAWQDCPPGSYMKVTTDGPTLWYIKDPAGVIGTIVKHTVEEHDDGTITVTPSIWDAPDGWHGWLERGRWRSV